MPWVVSRWHLVLLKNCLPARYMKLATVQGALAASSCASITPWFVVIVIVAVPDVAMPLVAGVPTFLRLGLLPPACGVHAHTPLATGLVFFLCENRCENPPLIQTSPPPTSRTTRTAPMPPCSWRRRRAAAARRAIWRSILARASARWRFLLEATGAPLPGLRLTVALHTRPPECTRSNRSAGARVPLPVPCTRLHPMLVAGFPAQAFDTNCYVVAPGPGEQCVVVDPGIGVAGPLDDVLAEHRLHPVAVLLTHGHLDHTFSVTPVCQARDVPAYVHPGDRELLRD